MDVTLDAPTWTTGLPPGHVALHNSSDIDLQLTLDHQAPCCLSGNPRPVPIRIPARSVLNVTAATQDILPATCDIRALVLRSPDIIQHKLYLRLILSPE